MSLRLSGFKIASAKEELARLSALPDAEYKAQVEQKKWEIVRYHLSNTPFYQKLFGGAAPKTWEDMPILTKNHLQQPLEERLSREYSIKKVYVGKTSGSSGRPLVFAKDKWCHALSWAAFYRSYTARGIDLDNDLQARFYGIAHKGAEHYKERFKDFLSSRYRFPIFDLNPAKMNGFLKVFDHKPFVYLNGYTSSILLFAKHLQERGIALKSICPTLKACITTSEMLFETDRKLIENSLGVQVINEYGASEIGMIALENSTNELIIDQNLLYLEILDNNGHVLPYGEKGRIVITSLHNRAHPFVRYDIGDLGSIAPATNGNGLIIKELTGRTNDIAKLPSGKIVPGLAFYYVTKSVMDKSGNVREFVVTQNSLDTFTIDYVGQRDLSPLDIKKLKTAVDNYLEPCLILNINRVKLLDRSGNGKLRQFRSLL